MRGVRDRRQKAYGRLRLGCLFERRARQYRLDALEWAAKAEKLGAGEILLTSMDTDGTKDGYDLQITKAVASMVKIPVIASGGAGALSHFADVIEKAGASAVLAASLFHYNELTIRDVKEYLRRENIPVRIEHAD